MNSLISRALAATVTISPAIPGFQDVSTTGPADWIKNFYLFALFFSGILAFGAIVFGGFKYATSTGNAHNQEEARAWIRSALLGILFLAAAYAILKTINPNLVSLQNPPLQPVTPGAGN